MTIHEKYNIIIRKCKFIPINNSIFVRGIQVELLEDSYDEWKEDYKFNDGISTFRGSKYKGYVNWTLTQSRITDIFCTFDEFFIYDENGIDISEFTLKDYIKTFREKKLKNILKV